MHAYASPAMHAYALEVQFSVSAVLLHAEQDDTNGSSASLVLHQDKQDCSNVHVLVLHDLSGNPEG